MTSVYRSIARSVLPLIEELARLVVQPRFALALTLFRLGLAVRVSIFLEGQPAAGEEIPVTVEDVPMHGEGVLVSGDHVEGLELRRSRRP